MSTQINFDIAKEKYPFLENLQLRHSNSDTQVEIEDFAQIILRRPQTLKDQTIHCGFENHILYIANDDNILHQIDIQLGEIIIYPCRNWHPISDFPDDVNRDGESVGEALIRYNRPAKFIILYSWGRTRFSHKDWHNSLGDNYETVRVAICPQTLRTRKGGRTNGGIERTRQCLPKM